MPRNALRSDDQEGSQLHPRPPGDFAGVIVGHRQTLHTCLESRCAAQLRSYTATWGLAHAGAIGFENYALVWIDNPEIGNAGVFGNFL